MAFDHNPKSKVKVSPNTPQLASPMIELRNISKSFGATQVLSDISFSIQPNEFVTLLGPSGCGKSTTLRLLAGFEHPNAGDILFEGKSILETPPFQRPLNTVFQRFALFPHLNVHDNVAFGLKIKNVPKAEIEQRVQDALRLVDLHGYASRWIDQLSGGQMQRVAIARAVVNQPKVLLLDEPLGSLDLKLRKDMQRELKAMQHQLGITFIFVTHDQEEALTMSDKIIVMDHGVIQQIGTPTDIYNEPKNAFVADFIGESNIVPGLMQQDRVVEFCGRSYRCVDDKKSVTGVDVVIRPEDILLVAPAGDHLQGVVRSIVFKGVHYEMVVETPTFDFLIHSTSFVTENSPVGLAISPDSIHIMTHQDAHA
ncbi:MAG: ABC transporter ATP-binding protein [Eubacteriales bacterium]|nr:ABC transporter ATP-binding protein [Eubacteriales bacterium]